MPIFMDEIYGRDLDLNLLRVFAVVAETGERHRGGQASLPHAVGGQRGAAAPDHRGGRAAVPAQRRGIALTSRGERLRAGLEAAPRPAASRRRWRRRLSIPATAERTLRLGLSDSAELWRLPPLLRVLEREAPAHADRRRPGAVPHRRRRADLGAGRARSPSPTSCPRRSGASVCSTAGSPASTIRATRSCRTLSEAEYFAHDHVIVSYNGDLRGIVEDLVGKNRKVRCSVSSFANIGAIVDGTAMLATIPELVAAKILAARPHLKTKPLPPTMKIEGSHAELLWPAVTDDDEPCKFVRAKIREIAKTVQGTKRPPIR